MTCEHPQKPSTDGAQDSLMLVTGMFDPHVLCGKCRTMAWVPEDMEEHVLALHKANGEGRDEAYRLCLEILRRAEQ